MALESPRISHYIIFESTWTLEFWPSGDHLGWIQGVGLIGCLKTRPTVWFRQVQTNAELGQKYPQAKQVKSLSSEHVRLHQAK